MAERRTPERPSATQVAVAAGVTLVVVVVVFGWLLPRLIDYDQVFEAIRSLSVSEFGLLLLIGLLRIVAEGWVYLSVLPGLRLWHSVVAYSSSTAVVNLVPGPWDFIIRYNQYRSWGFSAEAAVLTFPLSGIFTWFVKMAFPALAVFLLLGTGQWDATLGVIALIGLVVFVITVVLLWLIVRSESFARRLGDIAGRIVSWVLVKFKKDPITDMGDRVAGFRLDAADIVRKGWFEQTVSTTTTFVLQYFILVFSLRFMGIPAGDLGWELVFAVYAVVLLITSVPITPGSVGVAEAAYIALFTMVAPGFENEIGAAVFIFRLFTWLLPVPVGGLTYLWWRWEQRTQPART